MSESVNEVPQRATGDETVDATFDYRTWMVEHRIDKMERLPSVDWRGDEAVRIVLHRGEYEYSQFLPSAILGTALVPIERMAMEFMARELDKAERR